MDVTNSILIVDDDPIVRLQLAEYFKDEFEIIELNDGSLILDTIQNNNIDVVILDIFMQSQEGIQSLESLNTLHPELPVIMISSDKVYLEMTTMLGAKDTMQKPLDLPKLKTMINNQIASIN